MNARLKHILSTIALSALLAACGNSNTGAALDDHGHAHDADGGHGEDDHGHGHGGGVVVTDFSDTAELFVEFPPLAVGRESEFAAHFTRLDTFAAVDEGEVIVRLTGGGLADEVYRIGPSDTAGIFRPVARPASATVRRVIVELVTDDLRSTHDLGEYQVFRTVAEADASLPEEEDDDSLIPFLKEQQWKVDFATAQVIEQTLSRSIRAPGLISVPPNSEARIAASADGQIAPVGSGFPDLGDTVNRRDGLIRITPRLGGDLDIASLVAEQRSAQAAFEAASTERERLEGLLQAGAVPQRRVDEALTAQRQAEARLNAAQSRASSAGGMSGVVIRSPIDGHITEVSVSPGGFTSSGDTLFRVTDDTRLRLTARVAEADTAELGSPTGAWFRFAGSDRVYDLADLNGRLVSAQSSIDQVTRTAPVIFEFDNPDGAIRPGSAVTVGVQTSQTYTLPVIPASAIVDDAGQDVVFVMADGENWERRVIRVALREGDQVAVASGVEPGEYVVSRCAYLVFLAASGPAEAGHGHAH